MNVGDRVRILNRNGWTKYADAQERDGLSGQVGTITGIVYPPGPAFVTIDVNGASHTITDSELEVIA